MNERLKELAKQARLPACHASHPKALERFAELIRADECEACAKLCDDWLVGRDDICEVAKAIKARGKE
jgi:hypothetical protein